MKLANLSIGGRLTFAFSTVLLVSASMAGLGVYQLSTVKDFNTRIISVELVRSKLADKWSADLRLNTVRTDALFKSTDPADIAQLGKDIAVTTEEVIQIQAKLPALVTDEEGKQKMLAISEMRETYSKKRTELLARKEAGETVSDALVEGLRPARENYQSALDEFEQTSAKQLSMLEAETANVVSTGQWALGLASLLAVITGMLQSYFTTRSITRPVREAAEIAHAISNGILTTNVRVYGNDETTRLQQALALMQTNLVRIVNDVRTTSNNVAQGSSEIAAGNNDLSVRTENQASSLEETAASMVQLTNTVAQNAETAMQATSCADKASDAAKSGGAVVSQVVTTMDSINECSKRIVDIIAVIDSIAFQTNILALNAAVEAARAGEQGRGFAVVATEVRSLAHRSAAAAKEIKGLIGETVEKVNCGSQLVAEAGKGMTEIVMRVARVTDAIKQISVASQEQAQGIAAIKGAITEMDQATQQNASLVEEASMAASSLQEQSTALTEVVGFFKLGDETLTGGEYRRA